MKHYILGIALMGALVSTDVRAQTLSDAQRESIRAEIQTIQEERSLAFVEGDCERVVEQFDEAITFYTRGRRVPSVQALMSFCQQVERPFPETAVQESSINVLSETSAYMTQIFEFPGTGADDQPEMMREIITSIWSKGDGGWKIVHFHVSVDPVPIDSNSG